MLFTKDYITYSTLPFLDVYDYTIYCLACRKRVDYELFYKVTKQEFIKISEIGVYKQYELVDLLKYYIKINKEKVRNTSHSGYIINFCNNNYWTSFDILYSLKPCEISRTVYREMLFKNQFEIIKKVHNYYHNVNSGMCLFREYGGECFTIKEYINNKGHPEPDENFKDKEALIKFINTLSHE